MNTPEQYPTDLTQAQWELLRPSLPKPQWRTGVPGRPPVNLREVFNTPSALLSPLAPCIFRARFN